MKLTKELLVKLINEYAYQVAGDGDEPVVNFRDEPDTQLIIYEDRTESIVKLIREFTEMADKGAQSGELTNEQLGKIVDFQLKRIQRALDYAVTTIDGITGEDLDLTTPEV